MNETTASVEAARWLPADTFKGQHAVVTGGGTGLGLEISRGLATLGAEVSVLSRDPNNHTDLEREAEQKGWKIHSQALDVREASSVASACEAVLERSGKVDILVNNAAGNFVCPTERMSSNAWRAVLGIVLDGTFYCSRDFGRAMIKAKGGNILNIVATYATTGMPGVAHSASAKAGVLTLTKTLAAEWAHYGIRVNAIAPGPFESPRAAGNLWPTKEIEDHVRNLIPQKRFAPAHEVAAQCLWILSPASAWMTGECLVHDGGISLPRSFWDSGLRVTRPKPNA